MSSAIATPNAQAPGRFCPLCLPAGPFDFSTTRGKTFRVGRWELGWLRFAHTEDGKVSTSPELLPPAPWPHADQADYLAATLRDRGHILTVHTIARLRAWLASQ